MKQVLLFILTLSSIIFYSCEVPLNPNAPFRQRYVLTGIMRNDTSAQVITLTKNYQTSTGLNPASDTVDPAVTDAEVNIWYRDSLYQLRDSAIARTNTSQYKDSVHFYYINNLSPAAGEYVDIEALLPNGILLKSTTQMPSVFPLSFFGYGDDRTIPSIYGRSYIYILWGPIENVFYHPRIVIEYYEKGSTVMKTKAVPLYYTTENGVQKGVYPTPTKTNFVSIDTSVINKALNEIPQNGLDKSNYTISQIDVQLIVYDENLSTYYTSTQESIDSYTVMLDIPDYSDITGGYGLFASYIRTDFYIKFTSDYLSAQGYY
jgi:hypothetical protein